MIPSGIGFLSQDFELAEQPDKTYKLTEKNRIRGETDGMRALKQSIYCVLNTERYQYPVYSWNYGIELMDLYGEPLTYVCPELERRIQEALLCDSRITGVSDFVFTFLQKGKIQVSFTVHSVYGNIEAKKEVILGE